MSIIQSLINGIDIVARLFFEEPEVARYVAVAETLGGVTVPNPLSDHHFQNIHAPGLEERTIPVIFFRTRHTGRPTFKVRLNSTDLTQHTFVNDNLHSWHELIPAGALKPENNEVTLSVSGSGSVTFSDILILYRANRLTVKKPLVLTPG